MPSLKRLSVHNREKEQQSSDNHTTSQHVEATDGAPPDYAAPAALDTPSADVLNAAFANLKISEQDNLPFPDANLCLAHLKLLTVFHNLKEDIGYTDGLFDLWDSHCEIAENRDEALTLVKSDGLCISQEQWKGSKTGGSRSYVCKKRLHDWYRRRCWRPIADSWTSQREV